LELQGLNGIGLALTIHRESKPLGIKMTGDGFQSEMTAQFTGKNALAKFLADLTKEEERQRE